MTTYAAITGWGKCMPPAVLTNDDLSTFLDTNDEWIRTRTGMRERRVSHVSAIELSTVASARALACAGVDAAEVDLIIYGGVSNDELVPNSASGVQVALGATRAAAMDLNTACTSFCYGLATATAMIRTGAIRTAVVIGVELISRYLDWSNRNVAVLFGDGAAAVVLQATDREEGMIGSVLGCDAEGRDTLRVRGFGCTYSGRDVTFGDTLWDFDGQAIFKRAVTAMAAASQRVLAQGGYTADDVDLVVPHQANARILTAVSKRVGIPYDKFVVTIENEPSATVAKGLVTRTDPLFGMPADSGSAIKVYLSSGPQQVAVPSVEGKTEADARVTLTTAGLVADVRYATVPAGDPNDGKVISQGTAADTMVDPNSKVVITVGKAAAATTTVPPPG